MMFLIAFVFVCLLASTAALCPNGCNGHGSCGINDRCTCYDDAQGNPAWVGYDCSQRTCPLGKAWVTTGETAIHSDDVECSGKGLCNRETGICECFENYTGRSCNRASCPNDCSRHGVCYTQKEMLTLAGLPSVPVSWESNMAVTCKCDAGRRGADCSQIECPSSEDVLGGKGSANGRDCSGRGLCDYTTGTCQCFPGYYGASCDSQSVVA